MLPVSFRWNSWNRSHIARHGIKPEEVNFVVRHAQRPYPKDQPGGTYLVWGKTEAGRFLQVVYRYDSDEDIDYESYTAEELEDILDESRPRVYVIHARDLTPHEKKLYRRSR